MEDFMAKTNKQGHTPVIDPKKSGFPSTTGKPSGTDRAVVRPNETHKPKKKQYVNGWGREIFPM